MKASILLCMVAALVALPAYAATLIVPDQYSTIEAAILASSHGDEVLVRPGTYVENIHFLSKGITVRSEAGPAATIIDGSQPTHPDTATVAIVDGFGAVLEGFTIRGGRGTWALPGAGLTLSGGGVALLNQGTIRRNWITENQVVATAVYGGGGIFIVPAAANYTIAENRIYSNTVARIGGGDARGGGILGGSQTGNIVANEIFSNSAGSVGGGIYSTGLASINRNVIVCNMNGGIWAGYAVTSNTIVGNTPYGAAAFARSYFNGNTVTHNIGPGVPCGGAAPGSCNNFFANTIEDSTCFGTGTSNISMDPLYGEAGCAASFCLDPNSPLLPENSPPGCGLIGARGVCASAAVDAPASPAYASGPLVARPNPFNPSTTLTFELLETRHVTLEVYDAQGHLMRRLLDDTVRAGQHGVVWDGRDGHGNLLASGAYVASLRSSDAPYSQKLVLLK